MTNLALFSFFASVSAFPLLFDNFGPNLSVAFRSTWLLSSSSIIFKAVCNGSWFKIESNANFKYEIKLLDSFESSLSKPDLSSDRNVSTATVLKLALELELEISSAIKFFAVNHQTQKVDTLTVHFWCIKHTPKVVTLSVHFWGIKPYPKSGHTGCPLLGYISCPEVVYLLWYENIPQKWTH